MSSAFKGFIVGMAFICLVPAIVLAAGQGEKPGVAANAAFKISVSNWEFGDTGNGPAYKAAIEAAFKAKYPNAQIVWDYLAVSYFEVLKAKLASKTADDVFANQNVVIPFGNAGYYTDLTDQSWTKDMNDIARDAVTYKGKVIGAPLDVAGWGLFYNKKVFADLKLTPPKDWSELLAVCDKLKQAGIAPLTNGYKDNWTSTGTFDALGGTYLFRDNPNFAFDLMAGKAKLNGPELHAIMDNLQQLVDKGYIPANILSVNWEQAQIDFGEGRAGMIFQGPWLIGTTKDRFNVEMGFIPLADERGNYFISGTVNTTMSVNSSSSLQQAAKDLVAIMVSKEVLPAFLKDSGFSPYKGLSVDYSTDGLREYAAAWAKYKTVAQPDQIIPPSVVTNVTEMIQKMLGGEKLSSGDYDEADRNFSLDKAKVNLPSR